MKIYFAPLEGITDYIYRNNFEKYYGGVDQYYTPFLSPNDTECFTAREWKNIDPDHNKSIKVIPQLLVSRADHFLWAAKELENLGYQEINYNLGCPSGTVVAKKKGSGFLFYPEELDEFLKEIFHVYSGTGLKISVKTRIGKNDPEECYELLEIFNKYPIHELIVHPRIQKDYYREPVRMSYFEHIYHQSRNPVVYNGEIHTLEDIKRIEEKYPNLSSIMIGRALIKNPELLIQKNNNEKMNEERFRAFHDDILRGYEEIMTSDDHVLSRMKELWAFWIDSIGENTSTYKKIRKTKRISEYKILTNQIFHESEKLQ